MGECNDPDWMIAFVGGRTLIGAVERTVSGVELSPVYELQSGMVPQQNGTTGIMTMAVPVLMFPSLNRLRINDSDTLFAVAALSKDDRRAVMRAVDGAEKMAQQIRTSQAGLVVAGAVPPNGKVALK